MASGQKIGLIENFGVNLLYTENLALLLAD